MSVATSTAIIGGAVIAGGATLAGGAIASSAASDAERAQIAAQERAIAAQRAESERGRQFLREGISQAREDIEPFRQAQLGALQQLQGIADPQGELAQAERAQATQTIQRQLSAQGLLRSRRQVDLLSNLEVGLLRRRSDILGGLAGSGAAQQQAGLAAAQGQGLAGISQQFGAQIGSAFQNIGQAQAAGIAGRGQALGGTISGLGNIFGGVGASLFAQEQQQQQQQFQQQLLSGLAGR